MPDNMLSNDYSDSGGGVPSSTWLLGYVIEGLRKYWLQSHWPRKIKTRPCALVALAKNVQAVPAPRPPIGRARGEKMQREGAKNCPDSALHCHSSQSAAKHQEISPKKLTLSVLCYCYCYVKPSDHRFLPGTIWDLRVEKKSWKCEKSTKSNSKYVT